MEFQNSMNDLKSTSLDLLYSQVSSLIASYNELKASGELNDTFEKRLLLLQKTISSMKSLIQSVEDFNDLSGDVVENTGDDLADFISNSKDNKEEPINNSGLVFSAPLISNVPTNPNLNRDDGVSIKATPGSVIADGTKDKGDNVIDTSVTVKEGQDSVDKTTVKEPSVAIENPGVPVQDTTNVNSNDVNVRAIASLEKFKRVSDSPVKAIIVNDKQFAKLIGSLNQQAGQLDFGASSSENDMSVEAMIEKANDLYNRGERQAAEEIYNKINNMTAA